MCLARRTGDLVRTRLAAEIAVAATAGQLLLSACATTSHPTDVAAALPAQGSDAVARFDAAVHAGLIDARLVPASAPERSAEMTEVTFGAGAAPARWHSAGFPEAGVKGAQHLVRYDVASGAQVFVALLELDRPANADVCDAPWLNDDFEERPCAQEEVGDDLDLVTVTFSNIRETYLIGPGTTLAVTAMRAGEDGRLVAPVPVSVEDQRGLLLAVARRLADAAA
jgi:hypothetical protein